jgi:hypothetical protein
VTRPDKLSRWVISNDDSVWRETAQRIRGAIDRLPEAPREALANGLSPEQAAQNVGEVTRFTDAQLEAFCHTGSHPPGFVSLGG